MKEDKTELELALDNKRSLVDILHIIDKDVINMHVSFEINNLFWPKPSILGDDQRYLDDCSSRLVIPYSSVDFEYSVTQGWIYRRMNLETERLKLSCHEINIQNKSILLGNKPHDLSYDCEYRGDNYSKIGFASFRDDLLDDIVAKGYEIQNLSLWFKAEHDYASGTGYNPKISLYTQNDQDRLSLVLSKSKHMPEREYGIYENYAKLFKEMKDKLGI